MPKVPVIVLRHMHQGKVLETVMLRRLPGDQFDATFISQETAASMWPLLKNLAEKGTFQ